jgi:hypothetical protein
MKKSLIFFLTIFFTGLKSFACEVCENNQPKPLKGITHGIGPTGTIDYIIIGIASVIVLVALFLSIKYLVKPREGNPDHIKNIVLDEN